MPKVYSYLSMLTLNSTMHHILRLIVESQILAAKIFVLFDTTEDSLYSARSTLFPSKILITDSPA